MILSNSFLLLGLSFLICLMGASTLVCLGVVKQRNSSFTQALGSKYYPYYKNPRLLVWALGTGWRVGSGRVENGMDRRAALSSDLLFYSSEPPGRLPAGRMTKLLLRCNFM